jgi:hypothetical protein
MYSRARLAAGPRQLNLNQLTLTKLPVVDSVKVT